MHWGGGAAIKDNLLGFWTGCSVAHITFSLNPVSTSFLYFYYVAQLGSSEVAVSTKGHVQ